MIRMCIQRVLLLSVLASCTRPNDEMTRSKKSREGEPTQIFYYDSKNAIISGVIKIEEYFGPPGYGEDPASNAVEKAYILLLNEAIEVKVNDPGDWINRDIRTEEIHLAPLHGILLKNGDQVRVQEQFYSSHTGHHRRPLLMAVKSKL